MRVISTFKKLLIVAFWISTESESCGKGWPVKWREVGSVPLPELTAICLAPYRHTDRVYREVNRTSMQIFPLHEIPAFLGIGGVAPGHLLDPENTIREPAE